MDLTGQKFGKLTVLAKVESTKNRLNKQWLCRCDCGNERTVKTSKLLSGKLKSCGLCSRVRDLSGQRYGRLVVLEQAEPLISSGRKSPRWLCKCDCGRTTIVLGINLKGGNVRSCGCLSDDVHELQSRRTTKYCIICGRPFTEMTSIAKHKVTCSPECQAKRLKAMVTGRKYSDESRKKMADAHKNEKAYRHLDAIRGDSIEALLKDPRYGRFETNVHAIRWHLVSPEGETFRFRNLNHWLRTVGTRYFDLDDNGRKFKSVKSSLQHVKWKTKTSGRQHHYKGWAVIPMEES